MCPSYQVTHEEEHSTRGRARLLFEMLDGHGDGPIDDGWRSEEVKDALDLCLACKGCKTDCPANVDMATYKAEFLAQHYRHRLRPRADYATGWLPAARPVGRPDASGPAVQRPHRPTPLARLATRAAGSARTDRCRRSPRQTLQQWWAAPVRRSERPFRPAPEAPCCCGPTRSPTPSIPQIGRAAVEVIEAAGWEVRSRPSRCAAA